MDMTLDLNLTDVQGQPIEHHILGTCAYTIPTFTGVIHARHKTLSTITLKSTMHVGTGAVPTDIARHTLIIIYK